MQIKLPDYPAWICVECGNQHGKPRGSCATYHIGDPCGWCGKDDVPVTEPRDFSYPELANDAG